MWHMVTVMWGTHVPKGKRAAACKWDQGRRWMHPRLTCITFLSQRDRRRRDAPGGTRNIQKLHRWEAGQRVTKFRALLPLTKNMEPYILGDFREMQVRG